MRPMLRALVTCAALGLAAPAAPAEYVIVIHGGADDYTRQTLSEREQKAYRQALRDALAAARAVVERDGPAVEAVEAALKSLEALTLFDAGRGSVLNSAGQVEMDASIMDGATMSAGAVAGMMTTKHPISAARAVMERTRHVMLAGRGADAFAAAQGLEQASNEYFISPGAVELLKRAKARQADVPPPGRKGTVGAVVRDRTGRLAAGTSTGGRTNKMPGRIGDSPVIGAGTYANADCAVSATGAGELFIRATAAREVCARKEYLGESLDTAVDHVLNQRIKALGGDGGIIALDKTGHAAVIANTPTMFRGVLREGGAPEVAIFKDEK